MIIGLWDFEGFEQYGCLFLYVIALNWLGSLSFARCRHCYLRTLVASHSQTRNMRPGDLAVMWPLWNRSDNRIWIIYFFLSWLLHTFPEIVYTYRINVNTLLQGISTRQKQYSVEIRMSSLQKTTQRSAEPHLLRDD